MPGDERSEFGRALLAHLPSLRRYATALVGNVSAADDLVQDCIERALRRSATLVEPQRLAGWMRAILHNLFLDHLRRDQVRGIGVELGTMDDDLALSTKPEDHAAAIDLARAMKGLSLEHRQVLLLVSVEGLNYREVAEELGIPIGTVMSRLARARERLRAALDHAAPPSSASITPLPTGRRVRP